MTQPEAVHHCVSITVGTKCLDEQHHSFFFFFLSGRGSCKMLAACQNWSLLCNFLSIPCRFLFFLFAVVSGYRHMLLVSWICLICQTHMGIINRLSSLYKHTKQIFECLHVNFQFCLLIRRLDNRLVRDVLCPFSTVS